MASVLDTTISIVTLAELKAFIEESTTEFDNQLEMLINAVSTWMNNYTNRTLKSASRTEYYNGNDYNVLPVRCYPVTAVTSIHIDCSYAFASASAVPTANILLLGDTEITLKDYIFSKGLNNVKTVYTGGYTDATMPADLKQVALHLCKMIDAKANQESAGVSTMTYPNGSIGYVIDKAMPAWCKAILDTYVRL